MLVLKTVLSPCTRSVGYKVVKCASHVEVPTSSSSNAMLRGFGKLYGWWCAVTTLRQIFRCPLPMLNFNNFSVRNLIVFITILLKESDVAFLGFLSLFGLLATMLVLVIVVFASFLLCEIPCTCLFLVCIVLLYRFPGPEGTDYVFESTSKRSSKHVKYKFRFVCRRLSAKKKAKKTRRILKLLSSYASTISALPSFQSSMESSNLAKLTCEVSKLCALVLLMCRVQSKTERICALYLYLHSIHDSVTMDTVRDVFSSFLDLPMPASFQSGVFDDLHHGSKQVKQCYMAMFTGDVALKVSRLIRIIVAFSACRENPADLMFNPSLLEELGIKGQEHGPLPIITLALDSIECVLERISVFSKSKDINDLFAANPKLRKIENLIIKIEGNAPSVLLETFDLCEYDDMASFFSDLDEVISFISEEARHIPSDAYRRFISEKLTRMIAIRNRANATRCAHDLRVAPYSLLLYGDSGVGKSSLANYVMKQVLACNNFASDSSNVATLNMRDKFESDYKPFHSGVILDDIANAKFNSPGYVDHCSRIIDLVNNIPKAALQAEADRKGLIMMEPKAMLATTNVKSLNAFLASNEPGSILRRFNLTVTVEVKPQFRYPGSASLDSSSTNGSMDLWDLKVERVLIIPSEGKGNSDVRYVTEAENIGLEDLLLLVRDDSKRHFEEQKSVVKRSKSVYKSDMCDCGLLRLACSRCSNQSPDTSGSAFQAGFAQDILSMIFLRGLIDFPIVGFVCGFSHEVHPVLPYFLVGIFGCLGTLSLWFVPVATIFASVVSAHHFVRSCRFYSLGMLRETWPRIFRYLRDRFAYVVKWKRPLLFMSISIPIILGLIRCVSTMYQLTKETEYQGVSGGVDVPPDKIQKEDVWKKAARVPIPVSEACSNTKYCDMSKFMPQTVRSCRFTVKNTGDGVFAHSNIFSIKSNIWVMNKHIWQQRDGDHIRVSITRGPTKEYNCNSMTVTIHEHDVFEYPNSDLVFFRLIKGGSVKDITPFLLSDKALPALDNIGGHLFYRDLEGDVRTIVGRSGHFVRQSILKKYTAVYHSTDEPTFGGLCGAVHCIDGKNPFILGIHFGGTSGTEKAMTAPITIEMVEKAVDGLRDPRGVAWQSSGTLPLNLGDTDFGPLDNVHKKSSCNFLSEDANVDVYGAHSLGRGTYHSDVVKSEISDTVAEVTGYERIHGPPPNMNHWRHFNTHLENISHTCDDVDLDILDVAYDDLLAKFSQVVRSDSEGAARIVPLKEVDNVGGVQGVRFLDSMVMSTSAGWPLNCPKSAYIDHIQDETPNTNRAMLLSREIKDEVDRIEQCYMRGERAYCVFRANLKDEPTKFTKKKVRVFAGAPLAFSYLIRKYFLALVVFIQNHPIAFECAVGVNAHGPEWDELMRFVDSKGVERCVAGDYSAYDTRCSATILHKAYTVMFRLCEISNSYNGGAFSDSDFLIMKGLITDLCQPLYEHDGVILGVVGSNPSGHNLTVIVNNFANSLYMRYSFFALAAIQGLPKLKFDDHVSLLCYGDDNKMTVSEDAMWFNHTAISAVLSSIDVKYTMPDKEADSVPFVHSTDADFLKRGAVLDEELGVYFAPLDINSIFKSMHCRMRSSPMGPTEHGGSAINSACVELFFHGREVYETIVPQLQQVVDRHNLHPHLPRSSLFTYDEQRHKYYENYYPHLLEDSETESH